VVPEMEAAARIKATAERRELRRVRVLVCPCNAHLWCVSIPDSLSDIIGGFIIGAG
jgi:hypothetical protein